jgi:hypothetical protein
VDIVPLKRFVLADLMTNIIHETLPIQRRERKRERGRDREIERGRGRERESRVHSVRVRILCGEIFVRKCTREFIAKYRP